MYVDGSPASRSEIKYSSSIALNGRIFGLVRPALNRRRLTALQVLEEGFPPDIAALGEEMISEDAVVRHDLRPVLAHVAGPSTTACSPNMK